METNAISAAAKKDDKRMRSRITGIAKSIAHLYY
jgi:hypothetical protein